MEYLSNLMKEDNLVMVVYALDRTGKDSPWIYGVYTDGEEGFAIQEAMQNSVAYGHLCWTNSIKQLDNEFGGVTNE